MYDLSLKYYYKFNRSLALVIFGGVIKTSKRKYAQNCHLYLCQTRYLPNMPDMLAQEPSAWFICQVWGTSPRGENSIKLISHMYLLHRAILYCFSFRTQFISISYFTPKYYNHPERQFT